MGYYGNNDWRDYRGKTQDQFMHSEYSDNDYRDYLAHYGIKGMKWGKSIASTLSSGAHTVGGGIVTGAHAVGGAIGSGVNNVLTMVGLKKDPKKKHTRGKAKKRKKGKARVGHPSYKAKWASDKMKEFGNRKR